MDERRLGPRFRRQFTAQTVSALGDNASPIALAYGVYSVTHSSVGVGFVLFARSTATLTVLLPAGVLADRWSRSTQMVTADVVRCCAQAGTAVALATGRSVWVTVVLQTVTGLATGVFRPASTGLTTETVRAVDLTRANAHLMIATNVAIVVGPAVGGLLTSVLSAPSALALDAATFAFSAVQLSRLGRLRRTKVAGGEPGAWASLTAGLRYTLSRPWLWGNIVAFALFQAFFTAPLLVLGPAVFAGSSGALSWGSLMSVVGVAGALSSLVLLRRSPARSLLWVRLGALLAIPLPLALGLGSETAVLVSAALAAGCAIGFPEALWLTTLQTHVPGDRISVVSAFDWFGSSAARPVSYLASGFAAWGSGGRRVMLGTAIALAVTQLTALAARGPRGEATGGQVEGEAPMVVHRHPEGGKDADCRRLDRR